MAKRNITMYIAALIIADIEGSLTPEFKAHLEFMERELPAVRALSDKLRRKWNKEKLREMAIRQMKERIAARIIKNERRERRVTTAVIILAGLLTYVIYRLYGMKAN